MAKNSNFLIHLLLYNDSYINLPWKPRVLLELPADPGNLKNSGHDSSASNGLALRQMERYGGKGHQCQSWNWRSASYFNCLQFNKAKCRTRQSMVSVSGFRMCWGNSHKVGQFFCCKLGFQVDSNDSGFVFSAGEVNQIKKKQAAGDAANETSQISSSIGFLRPGRKTFPLIR